MLGSQVPSARTVLVAPRPCQTDAVTARRAAPVSHRVTGIALALGSAICFGTSGPVAKAILGPDLLSPWQLTQLRITGAAGVFLAIVVLRNRKALQVRPSQLPLLVAYGLIAFVAIQACYFTAVSRLPVGIALLLEYLGPVLVAVWARFVQKRELSANTWLAAGCAIVGSAVIGEVWLGLRLDGIGVLAALGAAVCLAGYFLLSEHGLGDREPVALAALGTLVGAAGMALVNPLWRLPFDRLGQPSHLGPPAWMMLGWVLLIGTVGAYLMGIAAMRHLPSPVAGVVATFEVVVAAFVAWVLLGETLSLVQWAGACVLLAGVILAQLPRRNVIAIRSDQRPAQGYEAG